MIIIFGNQKEKNIYKNACRIEPLGDDSLGQVYWYFSSFKHLVAEKKTHDENKSELVLIYYKNLLF